VLRQSPKLPADFSVQHDFTVDSSNAVNASLNYTCRKEFWVFDVPSLYKNCFCGHPDCTEEECDALEAEKLHDFNHSVYAPNSIVVTCKPNETSDGLPDWTWHAEGYKFHRPIPKCIDPTYCSDDPPVPIKDNVFYNIPPKKTLKYLDGEVVTYTCSNSVYRFPLHDGTPKEDWTDSLDVVCGWDSKWNPQEVYGCVDPRGCKEPPITNERIWKGQYGGGDFGPLDVGKTYWYECRKGVFKFKDGHQESYINVTCINDPNATPWRSEPPFWNPPYDHLYNPFPECFLPRKY